MTLLTASPEAAADASVKAPQRVHKFTHADDQFTMNRLQKSFYNRVYLPSVRAGEPVDLQGHRGYSQVLLHQIMEEHRTDPAGARETLGMLLDGCGRGDLPHEAHNIMADFLFLEGDFAAGFKAIAAGDLSLYLTLSGYLGHPPLTASQVASWAGWGLSRKSIGFIDEVGEALQARLDAFHAEAGISIVESFWLQLTADKPVEEVAAEIADGIIKAGTWCSTEEQVKALLVQARREHTEVSPRTAFKGQKEYEQPIAWPSPWVDTSNHYDVLRIWLRTLTREAENAARDGLQIPRVGEGLVSEIILLRQVEALFPRERVVHQARPYWLAPQSLDIYLPDYNIGIEYQGAQHSAPVEFFGGEETFSIQVDRDARKRDACESAGCALIEIHPGYLIDDVTAQIREAIARVLETKPNV